MTRLTQPQHTSVAMLALLVLGMAIFVIRVTGPSDLLDNDQMRPASYALDIVANGQWVVQTDYEGNPASKPPFSTWVTALISLPQGKVTLWTLYLPCALAVALSAVLLVWFAGTGFGLMAGLAAGVMLMLSPLGEKHIALARTDAMFLLTTTACAALAWQAMRAGPPRTWLSFWIMATVATLTKGPLGIALGGMGVLSRWWPGSRQDRPVRKPGQRRALIVWNLLGVGLLVIICLGWVVAAITVLGDAFVDRVIVHELAGHAAGYQIPSDVQSTSLTGIASIVLHWLVNASKPTLYLISRFAPWSLLGLVATIQVFRRPAAQADERALERFLVTWILGGLVIFSLAGHKRADLLLPLTPPMALLAGRELIRWMQAWAPRRQLVLISLIVLCGLAGVSLYRHVLKAGDRQVHQSVAVEKAAREVRLLLRDQPMALLLVDGHPSLHWHLGMKPDRLAPGKALARFAAQEPVLLVVEDAAATFDAGASAHATVLIRIPVRHDRPEGPAIAEVVANPAAAAMLTGQQ